MSRPAPATTVRARPGVRLPAAARALTPLSLLLVALAASLLVGSRAVAPSALIDAGHPLHAIAMARVDRTVLAVVVGAALGLSGACFQGLTRNPLADPGILGVSAGASLAMVVAISVLGVSAPAAHVTAAFVGAAVAAVVVHLLAAVSRGGLRPGSVTIAGAAVTAALTSISTALLLGDRGTLQAYRFWQVGTIGGRDLGLLGVVGPLLVVGALLSLVLARRLDALALGDDAAAALGTHPTRARWAVGAVAVLLAAGATALAGPVGFVGLLVPHAARALVGPAHGRLLPLSAVLGAALVAAADTLGRVVLPPSEVQVGIMTAMVGLPGFVWALRRGRL